MKKLDKLKLEYKKSSEFYNKQSIARNKVDVAINKIDSELTAEIGKLQAKIKILNEKYKLERNTVRKTKPPFDSKTHRIPDAIVEEMEPLLVEQFLGEDDGK